MLEKVKDMCTRREAEEFLEELGITGAVAESILRDTARGRHLRRVDVAQQALLNAVDSDGNSGDWGVRARAWALSVADGLGIGGVGSVGLGIPCTLRLPQLRELGKGRRLAKDGGAWDAAIAQAGVALRPSTDTKITVVSEDDGETWKLVVADFGDIWRYWDITDLLPLAWQRSVATRALYRPERNGWQRSDFFVDWKADEEEEADELVGYIRGFCDVADTASYVVRRLADAEEQWDRRIPIGDEVRVELGREDKHQLWEQIQELRGVLYYAPPAPDPEVVKTEKHEEPVEFGEEDDQQPPPPPAQIS